MVIVYNPKKSDFSFLGLRCMKFGRPNWFNFMKEKTKYFDAVRRLLGHSSVNSTSSNIGVTYNSALDLNLNFEIRYIGV